MRVQVIHAHFDDFELTACGLFTLWQRRLGADFVGEVVVCTDGRAGHHELDREETGRVRLHEQEESARTGGFAFRQLRLPDGSLPREACLQVGPPLLAALWKAIRDFRPDYLICPPIPDDPLAGMHIDHAAVAEAVRKVAYMINVPHAFTPEYPDDGPAVPCKVPVILATDDAYAKGADGYDLAVDIEEAFPLVCACAWCHQSQFTQWLPWVAAPTRFPVPRSQAELAEHLRRGSLARNRRRGIASSHAFELFSVTRWGGTPDVDTLLRDIPGLDPAASQLDTLRQRLAP